ncbi:double-strand break repair protein AddB [Anderseniella sp. Alg231-50]|uniref:double-strand break repair protein AddB n=1 Tax=Anderseniella sp. Alg231-50 TaxID=1922226 RepID=UPI000D54EC97
MTQPATASVFTIPPSCGFLPSLVASILAGHLLPGPAGAPDPLELSTWTILLPTRRAVRACRQAFIEIDPGTARLLPVIRALGDVDEDEIHITGAYGPGAAGDLDLPPAATQVQRQFLLTRIVRDWARSNPVSPAARAVNDSISHALQMAGSLVHLIDSLETGDITLADLPRLLAGDHEMPLHRNEAADFLEIISQTYPAAMAEAGLTGPQARRSALLQAEAQRLRRRPPAGPVIAAGSTGSVPATAELLVTVANLPRGAVILPGLDRRLDAESWAGIEISPQHPQYGMRELLEKFGVERSEVTYLPGLQVTEAGRARAVLASETMRPSEATHLWKNLASCSDKFRLACQGITELVCPEMREQALMIAMLMRKAHDEHRPCSLITPDRQLARRVTSELTRWDIHVDDSAGEPLAGTEQGIFFRLVADVCAPAARAHDVVALLGHRLMADELVAGTDMRSLAKILEIVLFRQLPGGHHLRGLAGRISQAKSLAQDPFAHPLAKNTPSEQWDMLTALAARLEQVMTPLLDLSATSDGGPLAGMLHAHVSVAEALSAGATGVPDRLWAGEAGNALSETLRELLDHAASAPAMPHADYCSFITDTLRTVPVRRRYPLHPKLQILGLLEARLVQTELVILGGLNEGTWPGNVDPGPWLSRPQHVAVGLQLPERRLGLAAHDFVQGLGAETVVLTWARKVNGTPAVASRWLLRLKAVLAAAGLKDALQPDPATDWAGWALGLDWHAKMATGEKPAAALPPKPVPPVAARPRRYSVSRVERLMQDPYWLYANAILKLKPLPPLDSEPGAAERGQLVHAVVERFTDQYPAELPDNAQAIMRDIAVKLIGGFAPDPALRALWLPQVWRMTDWFCDQEASLRVGVTSQLTELDGSHAFQVDGEDVNLTARADRIDRLQSGSLRIVDYKTGGASLMALHDRNGKQRKSYKPQLYLEGWIARQGGFAKLPATQVEELLYIRLSGGDPPGALIGPSGNVDIADEIEKAADGVRSLIASYLNATQAYPARAGEEAWNRKGDYDHLSRWREWGQGSDHGSEAGDGE